MKQHAVTNLALIRAKNGRADELGEELMRLVPSSRLEPGCVTYDLHRSLNDSDLWLVYEVWRSKEDLEAHFKQEFMQRFLSKIPLLVDGDLDLRAFRPISTPAGSTS